MHSLELRLRMLQQLLIPAYKMTIEKLSENSIVTLLPKYVFSYAGINSLACFEVTGLGNLAGFDGCTAFDSNGRTTMQSYDSWDKNSKKLGMCYLKKQFKNRGL